jgi:hypothetical protein
VFGGEDSASDWKWSERSYQTAKDKYYVPKLLKEHFLNLKVTNYNINNQGANHSILKAEENKT